MQDAVSIKVSPTNSMVLFVSTPPKMDDIDDSDDDNDAPLVRYLRRFNIEIWEDKFGRTSDPEPVVCVTCGATSHKTPCFGTLDTMTYRVHFQCLECWHGTHKPFCGTKMYADVCERCGHVSESAGGDLQKVCKGCNKGVNYCCGRLYHCQSVDCLCRDCFSKSCEECGSAIPDDIYTSDGDISYAPFCSSCRKLMS